MLYRFYDCAVYDSYDYKREPPTTVWIEAPNGNDALRLVTSFLSIAWGVSEEHVCIQTMGDSEFDVLRNAVEGKDAGDRRLWASGSMGERPTYYPQRVLIAAGAGARTRLLAAYKAAQAHAALQADEAYQEAQALRHAGKTSEADNLEFAFQGCRDFASADLI